MPECRYREGKEWLSPAPIIDLEHHKQSAQNKPKSCGFFLNPQFTKSQITLPQHELYSIEFTNPQHKSNLRSLSYGSQVPVVLRNASRVSFFIEPTGGIGPSSRYVGNQTYAAFSSRRVYHARGALKEIMPSHGIGVMALVRCAPIILEGAGLLALVHLETLQPPTNPILLGAKPMCFPSFVRRNKGSHR
ncbi:hypothetical protein C7212DRAFT_345860 [Tuber magnatum]|uniref:Uncharacterized protein n=1 Tax=Tuber magnatum TaxID=42249 RepID=A0A317SKJ8_9PEZI|nr:hypothetical protein C7212DRAFT_345860 [Tuber magnatum]